MPARSYTEDLDETYGTKPRSQESDADRLIKAAHEHDWVTRRVAVGSTVQSHEDVRSLIAVGITHVLDCQESGLHEFLYRGTGIQWKHCGTVDDGNRKEADWFHEGMRFGVDALAKKRTRLLVHCFAGVNRGPSMAYAVLRAIGMSASQAESAIRKNRPIAALRYMADAERAVASWRPV